MSEAQPEKVLFKGRPKTRTPFMSLYCPGCHYGIITRILCEVMEEMGVEDQAIGLAGVGCSFGGKTTNIDVDMLACPHGRAPAMATAIKRIHPDCLVWTAQGDGDLASIGMGIFMNAVMRGENITTIFLNNAGYGQTGGQMAPTSVIGQRTTTTKGGRDGRRHGFPTHVAELAASQRGVVYAARGTVHTPANFARTKKYVRRAFEKQLSGKGYGFVEIISACPPVWRMTPLEALDFIENQMLDEYELGVFKDIDDIYAPAPKASREIRRVGKQAEEKEGQE